ncbi:GIP, partial [Symbiodinium sp. CCMP2592]
PVEREPKAGPQKREKKEQKEEVKKERSKALSEAPWRRGSRYQEPPQPTPPKAAARPERARTPPPKPAQPKTPPKTPPPARGKASTPGRSPLPKAQPTPKKEEKKEEKEEESQEEKNEKLVDHTAAPKWKAGVGRPTLLPKPKLLKSPASWAGMRFRDRVAHQDAIRSKSPKGTLGEALLKKQGEACSTCRNRRTRFRKDAGRILKKRMKEYKAAAAKAAGSHYARKVLEREKLVRADRPSKDELRSPRVKKPEGEEKEKEEESDQEDKEPEAPGEEQQRAVVPKSPDQPTADQITQHEASGHAVHRSWCVHCQRARKMVNPHRKVRRAELETSLPTLHMDYFFLGKDNQEDDVMPHLVVRCDKTRRTWATSLPEKGTHPYNVTWLAGIIREAGWKKMCLFSDNENAMKALKRKASEEVKGVEFDLRECPTSTEHENAPANGVAEAAVKEVKRMVRAIVSELETNLKIEVGVDHPILAWIARHAAFLLTRFRIGEDGKSASERTLGRPWRRPTIVFGEQVMFKPVGGKHKRGSLDNRVSMGRYIGTASRNADLMIMTGDGVTRGHSVHRRLDADKWKGESEEGPRKGRVEKDYGRKVKKDQPALEGRPAPDAMEGAPLARPMEVEEPQASRAQRKRAPSKDVEDLYREEPTRGATDGPDVEVVGANLYGGASGSAGPGLDHSRRQAQADAEMHDAAANPPPASEDAQIGLITRMFEQKGMRCSPAEAKAINSMVRQLGRNRNAAVLWSTVNEGIILPMDLEVTMFKQAEHLRFFEKLERVKPKLLIGRLPTGPFQSVQRAFDTTNNVGAEARRENLKKSRSQLGLCFEAFQAQVEAGNYFLYECPRGAKSWEHELAQRMDAHLVEGPMCEWKVDESGKLIAGQSGKRRTRWITDSATVATALEKLCKDSGKVWNRELSFKEGIVQAKAEYPPKLERAVLAGVRAQLVLDGEMREVGHVGGPDPHEEPPLEEYLHESLPKASELYVKEPVIDANTGAELDPRKVAEARASELAWVKKQGVYDKVDESICWSETGRPPITLKWVDRNKGDDVKENFRSRLVVREVKSQGQAALIPDYALFSSMPPLEGLKILCSLLTSMKRSASGKQLSLKLTDISRAHFMAKQNAECSSHFAKETKSPANAVLHYTSEEARFPDRESVSMYFLSRRNGWSPLRGQILSEEYEFKCDGHIGPGCEKDSMTVLNRVVTYDRTTGTATYEADPRHAEALIRDLGMETAKPAKTPAEKKKGSDLKAMLESQPLNAELAKQYRSHTMRAAFLAQDRPDIAEATKSLARHMKEPTEFAWADLKRFVRYLRGNPRLMYEYHPQRMSKEIVMYCDSDHAGCLITRRSTTGLVTMLGFHCVKHSSNVQSTISLSSGESEFYAIVRAGSIGLSLQAMLEDWGLKVGLRIRSDSSAARGTTQRQGLGQARHVQTRYLWVQEKVATRALELERVGTEKNYSDICTKPMPEVAMLKHLKSMGLRFHAGRAGAAKRLV